MTTVKQKLAEHIWHARASLLLAQHLAASRHLTDRPRQIEKALAYLDWLQIQVDQDVTEESRFR